MKRAVIALALSGCLSKPALDCAPSWDERAPSLDQPQIATDRANEQMNVHCSGDLAVGAEVTMTASIDGTYPDFLVVGFAVLCGVMRDHDGTITDTEVYDRPITGGQFLCDPTKISGPFSATCPGQQVLVGVEAKIIGPQKLFNSVVLDCEALDPATSLPVPPVTQVPMLQTAGVARSIDTTALSAADCGAGEVVVGNKAYAGNELDVLALECAVPSCQPF